MRDRVLDIRAMLAPIPHTPGGAGPDLRADPAPGSPYWHMQSARSDARRMERDIAAVPDGCRGMTLTAAWNVVMDAALGCLTHSRDFAAACWFTEAATRLHGIHGAIIGIDLLNGLCDRYWNAGHPALTGADTTCNGDNLDDRDIWIGALFGTQSLGTMMQPLWLRPLYVADDGPVCLHELARALHIPAYAELDAGRPHRGGSDARHCGPDARAAVAELAEATPRLLAVCTALAARLARRLPAASTTITTRALDFADAVQDAAEILPAEGASHRLYC